VRKKVDAVILEAFESASVKLPCKIKTTGKPKMLRWQSVDQCLSDAYEQVNWDSVSRRLREIRDGARIEKPDFLSVIEASLSAQALTYDRLFLVKEKDALLPLTNSILKYLPADSLMDVPVYAKSGTRMGNFAGVYAFEKMGEISGTRQRHSLFQYTDLKGKIQSSTERLLLDSFGVYWNEAKSQRGFRFPMDKIDY
jgi:hypothetical protein